MRDLWNLLQGLLSHPIVLIGVIIAVTNGIGALAQKAVQRQREAERKRKRTERGEMDPTDIRVGRVQDSSASTAARTAELRRPVVEEPRRTRPVEVPQSPEDIAAEIRRRLGGSPSRGGELPEEEFEELPMVPTAEPIRESSDDVVHKTMSDLEPIVVPAGRFASRSARRRRSGRPYGQSARSAILAMEILGPPRALRDLDP